MRIGKREIDALTCPPGKKDKLFFDDDLPGFCLRVTHTGTKVFLFEYRFGEVIRRMTIGRYGAITPQQARRIAQEARGQVAGGFDPVSERRAQKAKVAQVEAERRQQAASKAFTLGKLVEDWQAIGLSASRSQHRTEGPRALRTALAAQLKAPAEDLTPATVQRTIDAIVKAHPAAARRLRDYGRTAFNWAMARGSVTANPFLAVVIEAKEISRDRVLTAAELREAWLTSAQLGEPFAAFFRLVMLTLQRRGEVAGMRWPEFAPDFSTWTIPAERAKNGKAHIVHLSEPARAILKAIPRHTDRNGQPNPLVFTTGGRTAISGFSRAQDRWRVKILEARAKAVRKAGKVQPEAEKQVTWRLHDLRRTGVTVLAEQGFPPHVADRILNHVQGAIGGVAAVYQRAEFLPERAAALDAWAAHLVGLSDATSNRGPPLGRQREDPARAPLRHHTKRSDEI